MLVIGEAAGRSGSFTMEAGLSLPTTPGLVYLCEHTPETPAETKNVSMMMTMCVYLWACVRVLVAACGDRGSLS